MKFVALVLMLISIDKFVITDKLPDVDKGVKKPDPIVTPVSKGCQCSNKCGIEGCQCQMQGQSSKCPVPFQRSKMSIDEDALKKALSEKTPPLAQWLCFSSATCQPCIMADNILKTALPKAGMSYSEDVTADVRKLDWDKSQDLAKQYGVTRLPTYVLVAGGEPVQTIVGNPGADYMLQARDKATKGINPKYAGIFDRLTKVGTIKRSQLNEYLSYYNRGTDWLGKVGKITFDNQAVERPCNEIYAGLPSWLLADLPANLSVLREETDGLPKFSFSPPPYVKWSGASQELTSIEVKKDKIVFDLPNAPNVWMAIEED